MAQLRIGQEGVRFRRLLVAHDLAKSLFEAVHAQSRKEPRLVRKGAPIDAAWARHVGVIGNPFKKDRGCTPPPLLLGKLLEAKANEV